jgi:hypothetical protein
MGFNLGALAGGAAEGIESGVSLNDQIQQRRLREAQLNAFNDQNLAQQAFTNSQIPGISVGQPQQPQPLISQMPVIGPLGRSFGLWGAPPPPASQPSPVPQQGGMMPPGQPAMPQANAAPGPAGPASQPSPQGVDNPQAIAQAIDMANPGLRQSNPAAFSQAVRLGVEYAQNQKMQGMDIRLKEAQIAGQGSENKLRDAQVESMPLDRDIKRAQLDTQRAETDIKRGELNMMPQKLKLKEAEIKLEEVKQEAAQAEMRLKEAELNAKTGDYASQREWRDAQIANMRGERMLKMQEQKIKDLKTKAEVEELSSRVKENESKARLNDATATGQVGKVEDKAENQELTKAQMQLRFHENQINDLMTSMNPAAPAIKAQVQHHQAQAQQYRNRVQQLEKATTTIKPEAPKAAPKIEAPRQAELNKISQKFVDLAKANDLEGAKRLKELMAAKGVPQHEIEWALQNARTLGQTAPTQSSVQVPMSR